MHPEVPEGINVSKTHPLADFGLMLVGAIGFVILVLVCAQIFAGFMVRFISFETEERLYQHLSIGELFENSEEYTQETEYLQALADDLVTHMDLPEDMEIHAHYSAENVPNAFATLGGNIVIYQGLIDHVSSENGLAMVVAHEITHVKNRDPIMALGRGTVSMIALMALSGFSDSAAMGNIAGLTGTGVLSKFSRDQETTADKEAVMAIQAKYGTLTGADEFFASMLDKTTLVESEFFSTHPPTEDRIERINDQSKSSTNASDSSLTPLPDFLIKDSN